MSVLQAEVYEAFRSAAVPDDRALKAGIALSAAMAKAEEVAVRALKRIEDDTSKSFSKRGADIEATCGDVASTEDKLARTKLDTVGIEGELATMRRMGGVLLTMGTAVLLEIVVP